MIYPNAVDISIAHLLPTNKRCFWMHPKLTHIKVFHSFPILITFYADQIKIKGELYVLWFSTFCILQLYDNVMHIKSLWRWSRIWLIYFTWLFTLIILYEELPLALFFKPWLCIFLSWISCILQISTICSPKTPFTTQKIYLVLKVDTENP